MRFEKLNENKIRITLNIEDLKEKNIDLHNFMSSPIESQSLFLDMLELAEEKIGFTTKDYKVMIEALAVSTGDFVFTLTRTQDIPDTNIKRKKVHMKRKSIDLSKKSAIYCFNTFDDFINFCSFLDNTTIKGINKIAKSIKLYSFEGQYYLLFNNLISNLDLLKGFCSSITEFASYVHNSELFERKLYEHGEVTIKSNAINTGIKYFVKKT